MLFLCLQDPFPSKWGIDLRVPNTFFSVLFFSETKLAAFHHVNLSFLHVWYQVLSMESSGCVFIQLLWTTCSVGGVCVRAYVVGMHSYVVYKTLSSWIRWGVRESCAGGWVYIQPPHALWRVQVRASKCELLVWGGFRANLTKAFDISIASPFQIGLSKASSMFYSAVDIDHWYYACISNLYYIPNPSLWYVYGTTLRFRWMLDESFCSVHKLCNSLVMQRSYFGYLMWG